MTLAALLQAFETCARCGAERSLFARVKGEPLCAACWVSAGCPRGDDLGQVQDLEVATRERMTARGSTDRHLVRSGKS